VPFELYYVRRAFTVMLAVLGLLAVGLTWAQVVRKISDATPPSSPVEATSVVWGDLVFRTPKQLTVWLRVHGIAYSVWSTRHPIASGALEHRPPAIAVQGPPPQPAAAAARAARHAERQPPSPPATAGGAGSPWKTVVVALLTLLAAAAAWAALFPSFLRYRYPDLARSLADHRDLLLAGAAALTIGILAGVVLN
jgi:hypothetical protein